MYNIDVDKENKLIHVLVAGNMQLEETKSFVENFKKIINQFMNREALVLISAERCDPLPQSCVPYIMHAQELLISKAKKVAAVHRRTVTRMQAKRLEALLNNQGINDISIMRYETKQEALDYLTTE